MPAVLVPLARCSMFRSVRRLTTCTELVNGCWAKMIIGNFVGVGDLSSTVLLLAQLGLLNPNVGLYAQTGANGYIGNYSSSSYNAMLLSLRSAIRTTCFWTSITPIRIRSTTSQTSSTTPTSSRSADRG